MILLPRDTMRLLVFLLSLSACTLSTFDPRVRPAAKNRLPAEDPTQALVVFVWPPCGDSPEIEESFMCLDGAKNRIRVVDEQGRVVTEIRREQYGAFYAVPGRHRWAAHHANDTCWTDRVDCIAALAGDLVAGRTYFVTFRWTWLDWARGRTYGHLDFVPVGITERDDLRRRLRSLVRVEVEPGLVSADISSRLNDRIAQDAADGVISPVIDWNVQP